MQRKDGKDEVTQVDGVLRQQQDLVEGLQNELTLEGVIQQQHALFGLVGLLLDLRLEPIHALLVLGIAAALLQQLVEQILVLLLVSAFLGVLPNVETIDQEIFDYEGGIDLFAGRKDQGQVAAGGATLGASDVDVHVCCFFVDEGLHIFQVRKEESTVVADSHFIAGLLAETAAAAGVVIAIAHYYQIYIIFQSYKLTTVKYLLLYLLKPHLYP